MCSFKTYLFALLESILHVSKSLLLQLRQVSGVFSKGTAGILHLQSYNCKNTPFSMPWRWSKFTLDIPIIFNHCFVQKRTFYVLKGPKVFILFFSGSKIYSCYAFFRASKMSLMSQSRSSSILRAQNLIKKENVVYFKFIQVHCHMHFCIFVQ